MEELIPGIYKFKEEFCPALKITKYIYETRKSELFEWLKNFYDYEILGVKPILIKINDVLGKYQPLPRKVYDKTAKEALRYQKKKEYEEFTKKALGDEFKPNSKSKIARDAIDSFGYEKYGHYSERSVSNRFIKEPFDTYGETNNKTVWVEYPSYNPMSNELVQEWKNILDDFKITRERFSSLYDEYLLSKTEGEDVLKDIDNYYEEALKKFKAMYGFIPVYVKEWKLKELKGNFQ